MDAPLRAFTIASASDPAALDAAAPGSAWLTLLPTVIVPAAEVIPAPVTPFATVRPNDPAALDMPAPDMPTVVPLLA